MNTAGIIAEYNPFHNGHAYHLHATRLMGATHTVVVMSGNYTQRGEAACFSKAARCRAALQCGADLVIELPLPFACASAQTFAKGAVALLQALGCVDLLSFGCECGDTEKIIRAARLLTAVDGSPELKEALKSGVSFPRARELALAQLTSDEISGILRSPNNLLAAEYVKALNRFGSTIRPMAVARERVGHDEGVPNGGFASASYLRGCFNSGNADMAFLLMPPKAAEIFRREINVGRAPYLSANAQTAILSYLRRLSTAQLRDLPDVTEGLENRIREAVEASTSLEELLARIKTKRYTHSRLRRIVLSAYLGINSDYSRLTPPYIRVLGFNTRGREILSAAKHTASLPIVSRKADIEQLDDFSRRVFALECLASDLYALCLPKPGACGSEQKYVPILEDS